MFNDLSLPIVIFSPNFLFFPFFPSSFSFPFSNPFDYFPPPRGGGIRNNTQAWFYSISGLLPTAMLNGCGIAVSGSASSLGGGFGSGSGLGSGYGSGLGTRNMVSPTSPSALVAVLSHSGATSLIPTLPVTTIPTSPPPLPSSHISSNGANSSGAIISNSDAISSGNAICSSDAPISLINNASKNEASTPK